MNTAYPISTTDGRTALATYEQNIQQNMLEILNTPIGSVFFNRSKGSYLKVLLFESNQEVKQDLLYFYIQLALLQEPRIEVKRVDLIPIPEQNTIICHITYLILKLDTIQKLEYNFQDGFAINDDK